MKKITFILVCLGLIVTIGLLLFIHNEENKTDFFSIVLVSKDRIHRGEELEIKAILENKLNKRFTINHASRIFRYFIIDSHGKQINSDSMGAVLNRKTIKPLGKVYESSSYKIEHKGTYQIFVVAEFSIGQQEYIVKSKPISINVD